MADYRAGAGRAFETKKRRRQSAYTMELSVIEAQGELWGLFLESFNKEQPIIAIGGSRNLDDTPRDTFDDEGL